MPYRYRVTDRYRTLLLLRHAKSDYPAGVADHDRPLAPRGVREAGLAGDWLRAHAPAVDAVLCSRPPAPARPWRGPASTRR